MFAMLVEAQNGCERPYLAINVNGGRVWSGGTGARGGAVVITHVVVISTKGGSKRFPYPLDRNPPLVK